jgi:hypothetical protein
MAEQNPRRDKAEGDRQGSMTEANHDVSQRYDRTGDEGSGITNRPLDEEIENQESLPERGNRKDEGSNRTNSANRENER